MKHNSLTEDIPITIIFKGFGIISDQEIVQLIGIEPEITQALVPSIYECHSLQIFTQLQVLTLSGDYTLGLVFLF